jgi:hypothetical protein
MKRVLLVSVLILFTASLSFGQSTFYFAHVVNGNAGGVWKTTIFLTNPAATGSPAVSGSVTLTRENGTPSGLGTAMSVNFVDQNGAPVGSGNTIPFQIPGGASVKFVSTGTGEFQGGFATVNSTGPISGTAVFSLYNTAGTQLIAEAGVPSAVITAKQSIFVDIGNGFDVGVAYANPNPGAANVTLRVLDTNAQTIVTTTSVLGSGNHKAAFLTEFFTQPPLPQPLSGTMQIEGNLLALALRFAPGGIFTTLPPVQVATMMEPAMKWFDDRPWAQPLKALARFMAALQFRLG